MGEQPLDVLDGAVGDSVRVRLKSGDVYLGALSGYDTHMNLVLEAAATDPAEEERAVEDTTVIRGDNVISIRP